MTPFDDSSVRRPHCVVCGARMQYARSVPRLGANPALISYECKRCGHVVTRPEDESQQRLD